MRVYLCLPLSGLTCNWLYVFTYAYNLADGHPSRWHSPMGILQSLSANLGFLLMEQNGKVFSFRKVRDSQGWEQWPLCVEALLVIPPRRLGIGAPPPSE